MKHPHALVLEKIYADFAKGDIQAAMAACSEKMSFQVSGKSRLAGKFDRTSFEKDFMTKLVEFSGGTFKMEVHDILASDQHAVVLASDHLTRDGKELMYRTAHIWRFEAGKPVAWYEYPRDLYQFDAIWG